MGQLELFAQRTFAEETERITGGAAGWQDPPEIRLEKVTSDGFLVIRQSHLLEHLAAPWPQAQPHGEVMIELKLPGNHLDRKAVERALLRRQAWRPAQRSARPSSRRCAKKPLRPRSASRTDATGMLVQPVPLAWSPSRGGALAAPSFTASIRRGDAVEPIRSPRRGETSARFRIGEIPARRGSGCRPVR